MAGAIRSPFSLMNNPDYSLLSDVVRLHGGVPTAGDNVWGLYFKWREAVLGTPSVTDGINELLWDLVAAGSGEPPRAIDSNIDLLRKLAGLPPGYTTNECLQYILTGGYTPPSFLGTVDSTLVTVDSTLITVDAA